MKLRTQLPYVCLFGLLSVLSACNQRSDIVDDGLIAAMDFKRPVELEFRLKTSDLDKGAQLCKVDSPHHFDCTISISKNILFWNSSEVRAKAKAVFTKKELIDLVTSTKQKYEKFGTFSYTIGGTLS
ncbi:hypothetical protein H8K33_14035 [Undibacterium amnicola]|uniref:Uncharacterized protein n=1 Tax=Undibacterium amnicola TaxID=1834038 RepID=A0ABR6XT11_9BURK|nr:hypothetical protein [Undibacterium amnicola]MBC3832624.1 hypothetical protein [Undibacterium amnicola]